MYIYVMSDKLTSLNVFTSIAAMKFNKNLVLQRSYRNEIERNETES